MVEVEAVEIPYLIRPKVRVKCLIGRDIDRFEKILHITLPQTSHQEAADATE
jgi:hypothetical protein